MDAYKHISLSDEEMNEAIIWAKQKKNHAIQEQKIRQREEENRKLLIETQWNYHQTKSYMAYRAANIFSGFTIDEYNEPVFELLCLYFSNDVKFESSAENLGIANPSLSKGIMLAGTFGTGKTWMMKLFSKNQRQVFHLQNAKFIADAFSESGEDSQFVKLHKNAVNDGSSFLQPYAGLCIDDIGTEDIKNHFGNKKNVIGDLIEKRYSVSNVGVYLHATTNFTAEQLGSFYGQRVVSRMREIFNFIAVKGKDRRL